MRRSCRIFLVVSLLWAAALNAQALKASPAATDMVDIEADRLDVHTTKGTATFKGNVRAVRTDVTLRADSITLNYDQNTRKVGLLVAEGAVSIQWRDKEASCNRVEYRLATEVMVLAGNVLITRGPERLSGQKVTLDLKNDTQVVEGGAGRVRVRVDASEGTGIMQWRR
jgi:lipopolysaccharide export system protein LptA